MVINFDELMFVIMVGVMILVVKMIEDVVVVCKIKDVYDGWVVFEKIDEGDDWVWLIFLVFCWWVVLLLINF